MAQHSTVPDGEDGGPQPAARARGAEGVHTSKDDDEESGIYAFANRARPHPALEQLLPAENPVLLGR